MYFPIRLDPSLMEKPAFMNPMKSTVDCQHLVLQKLSELMRLVRWSIFHNCQ
ncbi:MAG: hypothetical protein ACJASY_004424, partial [Halioglobus sp.]